jgi:hypothetical protein
MHANDAINVQRRDACIVLEDTPERFGGAERQPTRVISFLSSF